MSTFFFTNRLKHFLGPSQTNMLLYCITQFKDSRGETSLFLSQLSVVMLLSLYVR
jgi:hypothetical protein